MLQVFTLNRRARRYLKPRSKPAVPHAPGSRASSPGPFPSDRTGPDRPGLPRAARHPRVSPVAGPAPGSTPSPENEGFRNNRRCPRHDGAHPPTPLGRAGGWGGRGAASPRRHGGARAGRAAPTGSARLCPPAGPGRSATAWGRPSGRLRAGSAGGGSRWVTPGGRKEGRKAPSPPGGHGQPRGGPAPVARGGHRRRRRAPLRSLSSRPPAAGRVRGAARSCRPAPLHPRPPPPAAPHLRGAGTRRSCPRPPPCLLLAQRGCSAPRIRGPGQVKAPRPPPAGSAREQVRAGPAPSGRVTAAPRGHDTPPPSAGVMRGRAATSPPAEPAPSAALA